MPKVRRAQSPSTDCNRSYPYPSNSKNDEQHKPIKLMGSDDDVKEWEEARCPICMEPPHNAVLLKCSSHEMGCRPYMCNTSHRHSNCLDQFCKSFASHISSTILQEIPLTSTTSHSRDILPEAGHSSQDESELKQKLNCPLCRGDIYGYMVLEAARRHMNAKPRSCSSEMCEFQGTYPELRKHARSEHPSLRPSEVDPSRQGDWLRMEQERDLEDLFSTIHASSLAESNSDSILTGGLADLMSFFLYQIFSSIEDANRMASLMSNARPRVPIHDRRSGTIHRISNDMQTNQSARWRSNLPAARHSERIQRVRWRTNTSSSHGVEANRTARWRANFSSQARMPREAHQYYREWSPEARTSSTRMSVPRHLQLSQTIPEGNTSSFGRNSGNSSSGRNSDNSSSGRVPRHQLRWRDQRWSTHYNREGQ